MLRFRSVLLREESLQSSNRDRLVDLAAAAGCFARVCAHSSANAGEGIRVAGEPVGFFESSFTNQTDVASGIGMGWARHHAREVCVQPIRINRFVFESLQHSCQTAVRLNFLRKACIRGPRKYFSQACSFRLDARPEPVTSSG